MTLPVQIQNSPDTIINIPNEQTALKINNNNNRSTLCRTANCIVKVVAYSLFESAVVYGITYCFAPDPIYAYVAMDITLLIALVANIILQSQKNKVCCCNNG